MNDKIKFGLKQYFRPTPEKITRLLLWMKGLLALPVIVTATEEKLGWTVALLLLGFLIEETSKFVGQYPELFTIDQAGEAIKDKVEEVVEELKEEHADIQ